MHDSGTPDIAPMCEYVRQPLADCYCRQVSSRTIPRIARYCLGGHADCPVYLRREDAALPPGGEDR